MRDNLETYKIWAPDDALWTQWAKPVIFMNKMSYRYGKPQIPNISWIEGLDRNTMIIVDLPGAGSVLESLGLAQMGYRPVPLFNGVNAKYTRVVVQVQDIVSALYTGADELLTCSIRTDAPPVFMLDYDRMIESRKQPGMFDNRWCVFAQDMPSAAFLQEHGIQRIIVRTIAIQDDLAHILYRYQEAGIAVFLSTGDTPKKITVAKPPKYRSLAYRLKVIMGLTRNYAGGFGGIVPDVHHSSGGAFRFG